MTKTKVDSPADRVYKCSTSIRADTADRGLLVLGSAIDVMRAAAPVGKSAAIAAANLLANATDTAPWDQIDFSMAAMLGSPTAPAWETAREYGAADADIPAILQAALTSFVDMLADGTVAAAADLRPLDIFKALIAEEAEKSRQPAVVAKPAAPELFSPRLTQRVFAPVLFTPEVAARLGGHARLAMYRSRCGEDLRCLTFKRAKDDRRVFVMLETGEALWADDAACRFVPETDLDAYKATPPVLLAYTALYAYELQRLKLIDNSDPNGGLGHFLDESVAVVAPAGIVQALATAMAYPPGRVSCQLPACDNLSALITVSAAPTGAYVTAALLDASSGSEQVLMRADRPRYDATGGVFFFPCAKNKPAVAVIVPQAQEN